MPWARPCGGESVRIGQAVVPRPEARPRPRPAPRVVGVRVVAVVIGDQLQRFTRGLTRKRKRNRNRISGSRPAPCDQLLH